MRFAHVEWLFGAAFALVVAGLLILGGILALRGLERFGELKLVRSLLTVQAGPRRAVKGALLVLAVAASFLALSQPQYGRGTRLIPATDLDVVLVIDFSKSMYARDVAPSRIDRAKAEVARLVRDLPGARFGAVAFAGDAIGFPMTSDGAAVAQWYRQLTPNTMQVPGTAIARALEYGRLLFQRDPLSSKHRKVMVLVTDGEDLLGSPVAVAQEAAKDDIQIHVVQIGGRTPEPIPDVNEAGELIGWRKDSSGKPLTTSLSAAGEATLGRVANETNGFVVRAEKGSTGLREITTRLRKMMTQELTEKVETVYADVYYLPLLVVVLLLIADALVGEAPLVGAPPWRRRVGYWLVAVGALALVLSVLSTIAHLSGFDLENLRSATPRQFGGVWLYQRLAVIVLATPTLIVGAWLVARGSKVVAEAPDSDPQRLTAGARRGIRRRRLQEVSR